MHQRGNLCLVGLSDASRGIVVEPERCDARRDALRLDPAGDQRQGQRRPIPQNRSRPFHAGQPQVVRPANNRHHNAHEAAQRGLVSLLVVRFASGLRHLRSRLRCTTSVPTTCRYALLDFPATPNWGFRMDSGQCGSRSCRCGSMGCSGTGSPTDKSRPS
jgi:hypothetical protein